jgi:plastocyanin
MSRRSALPAGLVAAVALALVPSGAVAAPKSLSINATPNPVVTGDPVTIYGQLAAADISDRRVVLWHRIAGQHQFTPVASTRTTATGFYAFQRAEGVVRTNRNWFVRSARIRSRVVHEKVFAEVVLNPPSGTLLTRRAVLFTGKVTPGAVHRGDRVLLQVQVGPNGDRWRTVGGGRVKVGGNFAVFHRFGTPGSRTVRVVLPRDQYNLRSTSSPTSIDVQQAQNPRFTLVPSTSSITVGGAVTLAGKIAAPNAANQPVTLYAKDATHGYRPVASTMSGTDGSYSFTQTPIYNAIYQARSGARRHSAKVNVGVHDAVTVTPSATNVTVGTRITFVGSVAPPKVGHIIYLQRLGDDGAFHTIAYGRIGPGSQYTLAHTVTSTGTKVFRVLVPGGPFNQRGLSATVTVTVS